KTPRTTLALPLDAIRVGDRHRRDLGDIDGLAASIAEVGLLQPIAVTFDGYLIAGEPSARRRAARLEDDSLHADTHQPRSDRARRVRGEHLPQGLHALRGRRHQTRARAARAGGGKGTAA